MPVAIGSLLSIPEIPPGPPPPPVVPADYPSLSWITPYNEEIPLTRLDAGWFSPSPGPSGLGAAPISLVTLPRARGGADLHHQQAEPKVIILPLFVEGRNHAEFLGRWRRLADAFKSTFHSGRPGRFRVGRPDGTAREILAFFQDGYEGQPAAGIRWDLAALTLWCPDGYWRDPSPTPIIRSASEEPSSFLAPFPTVSSSQSLGSTVVVNPGGVLAWPVWTVTGPATEVIAVNHRRGESWTLDIFAHHGAALGAGETIVIETETGAVIGPDGSTWAGAVDWTTSVLWPLDPGPSQVAFTVTGAEPGQTSLYAEFYGLYETA